MNPETWTSSRPPTPGGAFRPTSCHDLLLLLPFRFRLKLSLIAGFEAGRPLPHWTVSNSGLVIQTEMKPSWLQLLLCAFLRSLPVFIPSSPPSCVSYMLFLQSFQRTLSEKRFNGETSGAYLKMNVCSCPHNKHSSQMSHVMWNTCNSWCFALFQFFYKTQSTLK